jgi:hypothetical protein
MLFDLRGRGRRRTVQVIYLSLAILMGGGLVLFGIGGNTNGGLFDAFNSDSGSNADVTKQIDRQITRAERAARLAPRQPERWANLARLRFQGASLGDGYDQNTGVYSKDGKIRLRAAGQAWDRYLALEPKKPDDRVASLMVQAFGPAGTSQLPKAVTAQEIVTEQRTDIPNEQRANLFGQLAVLSYQAGQTRKGDLAAARAVDLAPKTQKKLIKDQLAQAKKQFAAQRSGASAGATGAPQGGAAP